MPVTILTDLAEHKLTLASGDRTAVAITHVALGDGGGANYEPGYDQTALKGEGARRAIDRRHIVGRNAWRVVVEFPPDTPAFEVREMGFFDADGDLIAIAAGEDVVSRQTGVNSYIVDHVLSFSRVRDGLIIVSAPDDALFDLAVAHLYNFSVLHGEQLRQSERERARHGTY